MHVVLLNHIIHRTFDVLMSVDIASFHDADRGVKDPQQTTR